MGISLNGLTPAGTYPGLIKTGDNTAISGTPKVLSDGNGNNLPMEVSTTGVNLTGSPTVNAVAIANTTQVAAKQDTLVSGTNIKTINGTSVLGSGNIVTPSTPPSGVAGAIQFSAGSAFNSDAANLFWDDTNNRLGVGTNAPAYPLDVNGVIRANVTNGVNIFGGTTDAKIYLNASQGSEISFQSFGFSAVGGFNQIGGNTTISSNLFRNGSLDLGARLGIRGSGSTSATTSLLVQNSGGNTIFSVRDDGRISLNTENAVFGPNGPTIDGSNCIIYRGGYNTNSIAFNLSKLNITDSNGIVFSNNYNTALTASAIVDIQSTTKGFLPPRMTTTQKNAIASPAAGLVVYDSTTNKLQCYNGSTWNDLF
jgi:hypothetical protein